MTVGMGMMFNDLHGVGANPVVTALVWVGASSPGMLALMYAFRAWFGQIRE